MVLVVLVGGQLPGTDRGVERVRVGDEVRVSQVGGQVVRGGEGRRVGGRVALWRLGGHHHPADPCGILQHLRKGKGDESEGGDITLHPVIFISNPYNSYHVTLVQKKTNTSALTAGGGGETCFWDFTDR